MDKIPLTESRDLIKLGQKIATDYDTERPGEDVGNEKRWKRRLIGIVCNIDKDHFNINNITYADGSKHWKGSEDTWHVTFYAPDRYVEILEK